MNKDELLYHYFAEGLTKAQKEQFKKLLETDAEFKARFEYESNVKRVIKEKRHLDLKAKLNAFESHTKKNKTTTRKFAFSYWRVAASIALLIASGWYGYHSFFSIDHNELYSNNYEIYPNTVYPIKRNDTINSIEREAFVAYETGEHDLALQKFNEANPKEYFNFYRAQSYLSINNTEEAKYLFEESINNDKKFIAESYWYMALLYLREKNDVQAVKYLKKLIDHHNYNKEKAEVLYNKLH